MEISDEQVSQFHRDGFLILDQIVPGPQTERIDEAVTRVMKGEYNRDMRPPALRKPIAPFGEERLLRWMLHARLVDADIWELATDATLGRAASRLLQTRAVSLIEDQILVKPGPWAPFTLHQDHTYWPFSTTTSTLSCWIALSDMTPDMGPLEVLRGSHQLGLVHKAKGAKETIKLSDDEYLSDASAFDLDRTRLDFVPAIVPRGGGIFFHGLAIHGSRANTTNRWRRALALHWAAADCRLNSSKLVDYPFPFIFAGLRQGDRLMNRYMPGVHQTTDM
jgi:phytanoyl-CoA hydroxylase